MSKIRLAFMHSIRVLFKTFIKYRSKEFSLTAEQSNFPVFVNIMNISFIFIKLYNKSSVPFTRKHVSIEKSYWQTLHIIDTILCVHLIYSFNTISQPEDLFIYLFIYSYIYLLIYLFFTNIFFISSNVMERFNIPEVFPSSKSCIVFSSTQS